MRIIWLTLFLSFFSNHVFAQDEIIKWSKNTNVEWQDFKKEPNPNYSQAASINTGIKFSWNSKNIDGQLVLDYEVYSYMKPSNSWVKTDKKSDYLLKHEQIHFDITELHARKLINALKSYEVQPRIRRDLKNIYQSIIRQRKEMQSQYDKETNHSIDTVAQSIWQQKIEKMLNEV